VGTGFKAEASVLFGNDAAKATEVASSRITASAPPHARAEKVDAKVTNPDGLSTTPLGYSYGAAPSPTTTSPTVAVKITSISPASGDVTGGTPVQIVGDGFHENAAVTFGDSPAVDFQRKSTTLTAVRTPAHAEGPWT
jgi:hypothetical protein